MASSRTNSGPGRYEQGCSPMAKKVRLKVTLGGLEIVVPVGREPEEGLPSCAKTSNGRQWSLSGRIGGKRFADPSRGPLVKSFSGVNTFLCGWFVLIPGTARFGRVSTMGRARSSVIHAARLHW